MLFYAKIGLSYEVLKIVHYEFSFLLIHENALCGYQGESAYYRPLSPTIFLGPWIIMFKIITCFCFTAPQ